MFIQETFIDKLSVDQQILVSNTVGNLVMQVIDPSYMQPLYRGWGIAVLAATAASVAAGTGIIFRMVKIEV